MTRIARVLPRLLLVGVALTCSGCAGVLDPRGPSARQSAELWWLMFGIAAAVFALVLGILIAAALRRRTVAPQTAVDPTDRHGGTWVYVGVALPLVVSTVVLLVSFGPLASQANTADAALTVQIIGHRWWWEVRYPASGAVTANEVHIPTGEKVRLELTSADVIHSFWVPQLAGKRDLIPGQTNDMWIEASEPGRYQGRCAEYCGEAHARMRTVVVADSPAEFAAWIDQQTATPSAPRDPSLVAGQQAFLGSSCSYCHRVAGTNATSTFGPDLTHVAGRATLAAGVIPNTPDDLARWIIDPQDVKPGTLMPAIEMPGPELESLVAYLESLH